MKLVLISDTHGFHDRIRIPNGDVLIFAGDLGGWGTLTEVESFARWMRHLPHAHKIVVAGNHDWAFFKPSQKWRARGMLADNGITYLEDSGVNINGINFYGSPWTPAFFNWAFMYPRNSEMAQETWKKVPDNTDVLITHGPPRDILDDAYSEPHAGCDNLRVAVLNRIKPMVHVFGHLHNGYGMAEIGGTTFVNAAICNDGYDPINLPVEVKI